MTLVVPTLTKNLNLTDFLTAAVTLKLFSNNVIPAVGDSVATYTEVAGGGYTSKSLTLGGWTISGAIALYAAQDFLFTGVTNAPGTVYGYYVINGATLMWAERFAAGVLPFSPVLNSLIRVIPRLQIGDL